MIIKVKTINSKSLWGFPIAIISTLLFYHLYVQSIWWMVFSCLFAYFIQLGCAGLCVMMNDDKEVKLNTSSTNNETELDYYDTLNMRYSHIFIGGYSIMLILDLFPFLSMNESFCRTLKVPLYEGGILVFAMTIFVLGLWTAVLISVLTTNVKKDYFKEYNLMAKEENMRKSEAQNQEAELNQIKALYGKNAIVIDMPFNKIIISEDKQCVRLYDVEYTFKEFLSCSLVDDSTSETKTTSTGNAKTSTGDMLGRAVVGGIITGGLGAVAGAATAKKEINTNSTSVTNIAHKYTIYLNVNSLENPTITIRIGGDAQKAHKIANLFNVIIERNKKFSD